MPIRRSQHRPLWVYKSTCSCCCYCCGYCCCPTTLLTSAASAVSSYPLKISSPEKPTRELIDNSAYATLPSYVVLCRPSALFCCDPHFFLIRFFLFLFWVCLTLPVLALVFFLDPSTTGPRRVKLTKQRCRKNNTQRKTKGKSPHPYTYTYTYTPKKKGKHTQRNPQKNQNTFRPKRRKKTSTVLTFERPSCPR